MNPSPGGGGFRPQALLSFPFFAVGLASFVGLMVALCMRPGLFAEPVRSPLVLTLVHLAILGWMLPFVFGAAYQLVPVIAEANLRHRPLGWFHFCLHTAGTPLLLVAIARGEFTVALYGGAAITAGTLLAVGNFILTADQRSRWTPENVGLLLALFWLIVTVLLGLALAGMRSGRLPFLDPASVLPLHLTSGLAGFFTGTLIAVSYKLVPMFLLSTVRTRGRQWVSLALLSLGLLGLGPALLAGRHVTIAAAAIAAGVLLGVVEIAVLYARRLRAPDWPMRTFALGITLLLPATAAGLATLLPEPGPWAPARPGAALAILTVFGVLTPCILGMAGKIVPFLAWQWRYAPHLGRARVPMVHDLFRPALLRVQFYCTAGAAGLLVIGAWTDHPLALTAAGASLLASGATLVLNIAGLAPHLLRPRLAPLAATAPRPAA